MWDFGDVITRASGVRAVDGGDADDLLGNVIAEESGGDGEVEAFVVDGYVGFLEECTAEGVLGIVCSAP